MGGRHGNVAQEVYEQLKAREARVRRAEGVLAEAETEGLARLRAREEGIEATLSAREARLAQQVPACLPKVSAWESITSERSEDHDLRDVACIVRYSDGFLSALLECRRSR